MAPRTHLPLPEGCRQSRKARSTGTTISVYNCSEAGLDDDPGYPWATVCEDHGIIVVHPYLFLAKDHAPVPEEWCSGCRAIELRVPCDICGCKKAKVVECPECSGNTAIPDCRCGHPHLCLDCE